ncbi:MAG: nucleotidyltransferase family protein [Thermodesulfobacteriota bacterium]
MAASSKKIAGIILAAGSGVRMDKTKQLLPFKSKPLLSHVIENARQSNLYEIIVVLGHSADEIKNTIDFSGTKTVINSKYLKGQSTSLIKGLENISPVCDAAMFLLGDQPLITPSTLNTIIQAFITSKSPITIPYYNNIRGNPVIIAKSLFHELKLLSGDTGPRILFKKFHKSILKVQISDNAITVDVDTKADYDKLISK